MGLKHQFHSTKVDPADPSIIGATKWNADHYYVDAAGAPIGNVGAILLAGAAGALTHLNSVAAGAVLVSAGAGVLPAWAADLTLSSLTVTNISTTGYIIVGGNLQVADPSVIIWANRTALASPANGVLKLTNNAQNDFSLLQFGGTTAAFPALKRTAAGLELRQADDSAYTYFTASVLNAIFYLQLGATTTRAGAGTPEGVIAAAVGSLYLNTSGGAATTLYVKTSGGATNTGWTAK